VVAAVMLPSPEEVLEPEQVLEQMLGQVLEHVVPLPGAVLLVVLARLLAVGDGRAGGTVLVPFALGLAGTLLLPLAGVLSAGTWLQRGKEAWLTLEIGLEGSGSRRLHPRNAEEEHNGSRLRV
jgi:hypothetical protein